MIERLDDLAKLLLALLLLEPEPLAHLGTHHRREWNLGDLAGLPALLQREGLGLQEEHLGPALRRGREVEGRRKRRHTSCLLRPLLLLLLLDLELLRRLVGDGLLLAELHEVALRELEALLRVTHQLLAS